MRRILAGFLAWGTVAFCQPLLAPKPKLEFEVASVKVQMSPIDIIGISGGPGTQRPELLRMGFLTMENLLTRAFGVGTHRMAAPGWAASRDAEHYAVEARVPTGTSRDDSNVMLQNLLIERFGMKFHKEVREVSGFELVVAKGGPKLKDSVIAPNATGRITSALQKDRNGTPQLPPDVIVLQNVGTGNCTNAMLAGRQSMNALADHLEVTLKNGAVINKTGLNGVYDFTVVWAPAEFAPNSKGARNGCDAADPRAPILPLAIQELGLRLESKKVPVEMIVIDQLNKLPTEN